MAVRFNQSRRVTQRLLVAVLLVTVLISSGFASDRGEDRNPLVRQLTGRSEEIRQQTITRVSGDAKEQLESLDALITSAKIDADQTPAGQLVRPSTIRLIYLIGSVDHPDAESLLVELLSDDHLGIAMVAADSLGKNKHYGAIEFLKRQLDRPEYVSNYGFRFNLTRSLAQMQHPDAVEFLSDLEAELDGQLRFEIEKLLREVTQDHFLGDLQRFERWKESRKPKIVLQQASFDSQSAPRMIFGKPQKYYDIDIHAKRMMFIIDRSGSMEEYASGMTRLERAKLELVRAIKALPADSEFGITFFETSVRQWRDKLLPATEDNKREAIAFVDRLGYGDRTNTYGALRESLEFDSQLEVVFLLSDGHPTFGKIISPTAIVTDIMHRNRFRHINFNTIGISVSGTTEKFLRDLADQSCGEFRAAN